MNIIRLYDFKENTNENCFRKFISILVKKSSETNAIFDEILTFILIRSTK